MYQRSDKIRTTALSSNRTFLLLKRFEIGQHRQRYYRETAVVSWDVKTRALHCPITHFTDNG